MDPNAALNEMYSARTDWQHSPDGSEEENDAIGRFMEAFDSLDQWLSNGGYLPDAWQPKDKPRLRALLSEDPSKVFRDA